MSDDWRPYVVRQGDYLSKIAHALGFDADAVWNDSKNEDLRRARPNREMLNPCDVLWVPDVPAKWQSLATGQTNTFTSAVPTVSVALTLLGTDGKPLSGRPYTVQGLPAPLSGSTDGDGKVSLSVPVNINKVTLVLDDGTQYCVAIGHMDPIEEMSGVSKRLVHLGYLGASDFPEGDDSELRIALAAFQREHGLTVTGEADDATRRALVEAHDS